MYLTTCTLEQYSGQSEYANITTNIFISISEVCSNLTVEVFSLGSKQYAAGSIKIKYDYDI